MVLSLSTAAQRQQSLGRQTDLDLVCPYRGPAFLWKRPCDRGPGRRPDLIVGKPNTGIVEAVLRRTGLKCEELAMVGDRLYTDIETGLRSGMLSILVMSGETTEEMLSASSTVPDLKFGRLSDMNEYL